jgi:predicted hydrocarbon binding protein
MSSTNLYEIVKLPDGDYVLRRADEQEEPLIKIHFSKDAESILQEAGMEVAKAMIDAGIDMVEQMGDEMAEHEEDDLEQDDGSRVLH